MMLMWILCCFVCMVFMCASDVAAFDPAQEIDSLGLRICSGRDSRRMFVGTKHGFWNLGLAP